MATTARPHANISSSSALKKAQQEERCVLADFMLF